MATRKSNQQTQKKALKPVRLSGNALDDVICELQIFESTLYAALKAFTCPDFKPADDMKRNAYSTLVVVQDRLAALMGRQKIPYRDGLRAVESIEPGLGIRWELAKLHEMIDLMMERTGSNGCPEAPSILHVLHAETASTLEFAESLKREAA